MKKIMLVVSCAALMAAMTGCNSTAEQEKKAMDEPFRQERDFMRQAIRQHSPDVMRVDLVDSTLVYTHIYDGIIDVKAYTFDGDVCVAAERVYTFPDQMSALRHYRDAIERAELYDNIELFKNQVRYKLKEDQHKRETKGMTKEQIKAKFDKQIEDAKAAGADYVGGMDLVEKITKENWFEFDVVVASPDMMGIVGRLGKVLGPKGLMPSPKAGTVTPNVGAAVKEIKAGKVEYRLDKTNIIHCPIGKVSFGSEKLQENMDTLVKAVVKAKPAAAKGQYIRSCTVASTMGPGVKVNTTKYI